MTHRCAIYSQLSVIRNASYTLGLCRVCESRGIDPEFTPLRPDCHERILMTQVSWSSTTQTNVALLL